MLKRLTIVIYIILTLLFSLGVAIAAPCDIKPSTPYFISHDLTVSYCELCNYGYITIIIANPYDLTDMTDMTVVENLGNSGLTYDSSAPNPVTYSLNGGPPIAGGAPGISGPNGHILTWTDAEISALLRLNYHPNINNYSTLSITFAVSRDGLLTDEGLISATRLITAELTYDTEYEIIPPTIPPSFDSCPGTPVTVNTGANTLALREPDPSVTKGGRNVDAAQGGYSTTVYGNDLDDVIWRVRVANSGDADLQDLGLDDVMASGNLNISYICPSEVAAEEIAINTNGAGPSSMGCLAVLGNSVYNFDVDDPFGNPPVGFVDVSQGGSTDIYLVGKVPVSAAGVGACSVSRTNTVSNIRWGCENDGPNNPGGINATSTGSPLDDVTATLSTQSDRDLAISVAYLGYPGNPVTGARGRVRITIRNNSGGTVSDLVLTNDLPPEYMVDATHPVTIVDTGAYGYYPGLTDQITWDNPDLVDPLNNNIPQFILSSSEATNSGQRNLLRNGDRLVVTFGIILVRPESYDKEADVDVIEEVPGVNVDDTDPNHAYFLNDLPNNVTVDFNDFCSGGNNNTYASVHTPDPEDLDIQFSDGALEFILTGDPAQLLPLTVELHNRGGHEAEDYTAYVAFGQTMEVMTTPGGCSLIVGPRPLEEWQDPTGYPANAAVYECTGLPIAASAQRNFTFEVRKSLNDADILADDLTFRADVFGEITDFAGNLLTYPDINVPPRGDGGTMRANNYSHDALRARVVGFNLLKSARDCTEDPSVWPVPPTDLEVQIGEECTYFIESGGWFGFQTPGWTFISVQDIELDDELPNGQGWIVSGDPSPPENTHPDIVNIVRTPNPLNQLEDGWVSWAFNFGVPITQLDRWFRRTMTTRILNDPLNASGGPNQHAAASTNTLNSRFLATFEDSVSGFTVTRQLGPGTVGYPEADLRRVSLTVTEPELTVVKEVCNESLSGTGVGPGCTPWVTTANDGDALNSYIYRLTVANEASSGGVGRAPAYDVTVTDTLDVSDLAYVQLFGSDGLNNDGDAFTDEAGVDEEGSISDNTVGNATPAVITFSYTHSTALERIDAGDSVQLHYRVDFDDDAAPLQTFTNTAVATYDSLEGDFGSMSDPPLRANGDIGGARVYTSPTASADVQIIPIQTQPKRIGALSNTPPAGSGTQGVSIGEEIDYRLNTLLPVALLREFVIHDVLPTGITCEECPEVDLNAAPYSAAGFEPGGVITPTCTDSLVEWDFGDQRITSGTAGLGNRYDFEIGFIARVANTVGNNDGGIITNGNPSTNAFARYVDDLGATIIYNFNEVDIEVREPLIALTKVFAVANADAVDVLTVTVTATNNGTATAYNLRVLDDLTGTNLTYIGNPGGANPPDTVDTTTFGPNQPIFSWSAPNGINAGNNIIFTFEVRVDNGVQPQEILDNTIQADWTSLPSQNTALINGGVGPIGADGAVDGMRNGALPNAGNAINDYEATATDEVLVPVVVLTKTDLNPAVIPTIGVHKSFQIDITLPEGVTNNLTVTDTLNSTGLSYVLENEAAFNITYTFQGIATINGAAPIEAAFTAFPADETSNSAVWNIGTVVTQTENDTSTNAINPLIRINYFARINNDAVTDAGDTLQNSVALSYTHGETSATVTLTETTAIQTVVEPSLGLGKFVANVTNPGNPPQAGDTLRYTLTFTAAGGAPGDNFSDAFDLRIDDSLTLGLIYNGNPTVGGAGNTIAAPLVTGDGVTTPQTLRWSLEDGNADIDITEGTVVNITYDVLVDNSVLIGQSLGNSVMAQWTSLDGPSIYERNGTATPAYNDYFIGPVTATVVVGDNTATAKTRLLDTYGAGDNVVRIGDILEYELRLSLQEGTYNNVSVIDTLPQGLLFEEIASINGDTTAPYAAAAPFLHADIPAANIVVVGNAATGPTTVTMTLGNIVNQADGNAANDVFIIIYRARVLNLVHPQVNNIALTNTAAMSYETISGPATTITDTETIDVRQPNLSVAKSAVAAGGDTVLDANELVTYTIDITNNGTAPAYDSVLRDIIPVGMRNGAATITMIGIEMPPGNARANLAPVYDAITGAATWDFDSGTADQYTIPAGETLRVVYQTQTDAGLAPGMTLTNQAQVQLYYSFDDDAVPTLGAAVGVREIYGPSNTASVTFTTAGAAALDKANTVASAVIGQPFTYRITVPATPQTTALHDVRILDDLGASASSLTFISVAKVSGSEPWTPVNTATATNLVIEDTTVGIDIPAGEQAVIDVTVRLVDTAPAVDPPPAPNNTGALFANTADYTYNQINGDAGSQQSGASDTTADMTIIGPDMLVMDKIGPATMSVGTPAGFVLDIQNTWTGDAWNLTIVDRLPDDAVNGGTCGAGPSNISAQFFDDLGAPISGVLVDGTHYTVSFAGAPTCEWTLQLLSAAGALGPTEHLVINYETVLDPDTQNAVVLTNVAGVTQWYGYDPNAVNAAPHQYTYALTDGTPGDPLDQEDAHIINTLAPDLDFFKHVRNTTTGQDPGLNASPGDTLHYTLEIINNGLGGLTNFTIVDEVDALNSPAYFVAGSLALTNVPAGADTTGTDPLGGANGTGLINITNLNIGAAGGGSDTLVVEFEVTLVPVIPSGTVVLNQAGLTSIIPATILSDDPNVAGNTDPTETLIASAPQFQVQKISTDMTDDPAVLMAGDTLRYTLTIKNIGDENAVNVQLQDLTPANTTYAANSTTLNGAAVPDSGPGVNPLIAGIPINAPENTTPGQMRADPALTANNVATVIFDVVIDPAAMNGLIIENQGFVNSDGEGSGSRPSQPSDDPDTPVPDDPTRDVVGNVPLLYAHKTVVISVDNGTVGIVDPGDTLRYTIDISNSGAIAATGVVLTDAMPTNTTYVPASTQLNGVLQPDVGGLSPLVAGLAVQSSDNPGSGIISSGQSAAVTFDVTVNGGLPAGTIISNQGDLTSNELPPGLTDADGLPSNGYQPTIIVVGAAQLLTITKDVAVVGSGTALAGGQLEYTIRVTNVGSLPGGNVVVTDDLGPPLAALVTYVPGSGTLDGAPAGVTYVGSMLTADYAATYGDLPTGATTVVRFRVQINATVAIGTTITNTGVVHWNSPEQTASASVSIDVGGTPGSSALNGNAWHDTNFDAIPDSGEILLTGWTVNLYLNNVLVTTVLTDDSGTYRLSGLLPNAGTSDPYEIRFRARGAGANAASLGYADSVFTDGPHRISDITVSDGGNLQNLNLPITPNGTVYNSVVRVPIAGVTVTMLNAVTGAPCPSGCFDDPFQQNQVTAEEGYYKFDMNFSDGGCPAGGAYLIEVTQPATGYMDTPSLIIPPANDATTPPFSVPACPGDAIPVPPGYCEIVVSPAVPPVSVPPRTDGTIYYLHLLLDSGSMPGSSQIFNNPIPIDPEMDGAVAITKTSSKTNVTRGALVPYTITVTNVYGVPLYYIGIVDRFPAGFKYVAGSARLNDKPTEPTIDGLQLAWDGLEMEVDHKVVIKFLLVVGSGVSEGDYVNRAQVRNNAIGEYISGEATATVRVIPDPDFDCTDVIGKVFDDLNMNGRQDPGEKGLAGARVVTARGLIVTTDEHGRFHITCAAVPDSDRGSNFILKLDERSLPTGYRLTTENPRVQRATRGKMIRFNFGATIHRVVRIDITDGVFEPDTCDLRLQWKPKIDQLLKELKKAPSVLRLSYLADIEAKGLVIKRLNALKQTISRRWKKSKDGYPLDIETEIYWRRGAPVKGRKK